MVIREKKNILNILSSLIITGGYFWYVFESNPLVNLNTDELLKFWATTMLILIPVKIVGMIIIHIVYGITGALSKSEAADIKDERDRLIELKSTRNAQYVFGGGFMLAMVALAMDMSVNIMFIIILSFGVLSEISEHISKLYFDRKGIKNG